MKVLGALNRTSWVRPAVLGEGWGDSGLWCLQTSFHQLDPHCPFPLLLDLEWHLSHWIELVPGDHMSLEVKRMILCSTKTSHGCSCLLGLKSLWYLCREKGKQ